MFNLIVLLTSIREYAKDLHYSMSGIAFYSNHKLMDRIQKELYEFIDEIKESYYLANKAILPTSREVFEAALEFIPKELGNIGLPKLYELIKVTVYSIEDAAREIKADSGDSDLLGRISANLKNSLGILGRVIEV